MARTLSQDWRVLRNAVLWIDDEICANDAAARLLRLGGFPVDCVDSGTAGLVRARSRTHGVILLDLNLPDMSGLDLLGRLVHEEIGVPVVVLTRYGDVESAVTAMRLGATDFRRKPISGDKLAELVASIIENQSGGDAATTAEKLLASLLKHLDALTRVSVDEPSSGQTGRTNGRHSADRRLSTLLLDAMLTPALPAGAFIACAEFFKACALVSEADGGRLPHEHAIGLMGRLGHPPLLPGRVEYALARLQASVAGRVRLREHSLAAELGVDPSHLGRLLRCHTGRGFREWRRAFAMKQGILQLGSPDLQIAQIAYAVGFEHPSQFDREFRQMFGLTPTAFRRLLHTLHLPSRDVAPRFSRSS
jgi:FixJ family two-component response regulator/AraC-like DNA-binding protein